MKYDKLVAGAVILLASGIALAANDTKTFHGAICRGLPGSNVGALDFGASCDGANCAAVCPLIRDLVSDTDTLEHIVVEVRNANADSLSCSAITQSEDISGSILDIENQGIVVAGEQQFTFTGLDASSGDEGSYVVQCGTMRLGDRIYHLSVFETNNEGGAN
jgi:hypothetical protein